MGGEFLEGEFFRGPLLLEKKESKNSSQEFGSKIRASKIRFTEFGPEFGFRRRKIPCSVQTFVPDEVHINCELKHRNFEVESA